MDMSSNPMDYHVNLTWDQKNLTYLAQCVELPNCVGKNEDPRVALNDGFLSICDELDHRKQEGIPIPDVSAGQCPCCREFAYRMGVCSYCDYEDLSAS